MKKLLTLTLSLLMAFSMCLTVSAAGNAFEVDENENGTFSDAINAVADGVEKEIKLVAEEYEEDDYITVTNGKKIILNLQGNTLNVKGIKIESGAELTITGEGKIKFKAPASINKHIVVNGAFTLKNGTIDIIGEHDTGGWCNIISAEQGSTVIIEGGGMENDHTFISVPGSNVTVEVSGGTWFTGSLFKVDNVTNTSIEVSGGTFSKKVDDTYLKSGFKNSERAYGINTVYDVVPVGNTNTNTSTTTTTTSTKSYDAKDKNQDGVITCDEEMDNPNWVWSDAKGACVYSVTNTSVR